MPEGWVQRSEGNEASFSLPVGGALLSRKGSREGDEVERRSSVWREKKKRREEEQRNWADTRLEKKLKYTPSPSLCLVAIQFLRVSTREDIRPHGKPDPSSSPPSSPKVGPNLAAFPSSTRIFFSTTIATFPRLELKKKHAT